MKWKKGKRMEVELDECAVSEMYPGASGCPHRRLFAATIERAMRDSKDKHPRIQEEAHDWLLHEGDEPFSFYWLCAALELDHEKLRIKLLEAGFFPLVQ